MAACVVWMRDYLIIFNILGLLVIQVALLVRSLNMLNNDLESFFDAMRSNDSSLLFTHRKKNSAFIGLYQQLENINKNIQQIKIDNQNQNQFFKVLVEHVGVGLIAFNSEGKVTLYNRAASEMLHKTHLFRISELDNIQPGLSTILEELQPSEQRLVSLYRHQELLQLSFKSTWIKILDEQIKLVSLQNIKNELDEKELESWQKLIRVLTHELMNSAGPMSSTIATLNEFITTADGKPKEVAELTDEMVEDIATGLHILEERSIGMVEFVTRFRNLTILPKPTFATINIAELFAAIKVLMNEKLNQRSIEVEIKVSNDSAQVVADRSMMEQILLNLVSNAIYALEETETPRIWLIARLDENKQPVVIVADNGKGIAEELQDKIFIPFFTTRNDGSGIGLSLSRQMMRLHGGTLTMTSTPGEMTVFTMKW
ncbi:sensor histidine kinase [Williamwhitmania taraxaci]|nr:ATP-binding protein [Williamwhitmania taraxaci]